MRIQITKCYLVQVLDEDGNEVSCEYVFKDTKKEAEIRGNELLEEVLQDEDRGESSSI